MITPKDFQHIRDAAGTIVEVTEELKNYALGVVSPVLGLGCFAMGEPVFGFKGSPSAKYYWFTAYKGSYYAVFGTRDLANKVFLEMRGKKRKDRSRVIQVGRN